MVPALRRVLQVSACGLAERTARVTEQCSSLTECEDLAERGWCVSADLSGGGRRQRRPPRRLQGARTGEVPVRLLLRRGFPDMT
jgi:hypothetical protein